MSKNRYRISVVMPNYNTPIDYLKTAVESILSQTYKDFEYIIVDDRSTDDSYEYLKSLTDPRIRVIRNKNNLGITKTLNVGFDLAQGEYIARMDSDDIALPDRLETQLRFMDDHPDVIVCGAWAELFGDENYCMKREMPEQEFMRCSLLFGNLFGLVHPTAFFRRSLLVDNHIRYDEGIPTAQDYAMWASCADVAPMACVQKVLLRYRIHGGQVSISKENLQIECARRVQKKLLERVFQRIITDSELQLHTSACNFKRISKADLAWLSEIESANQISKVYQTDVLKSCIDFVIKSKAHNDATTTKRVKSVFSMLSYLPLKGKVAVANALVDRIWTRILILFGIKKRKQTNK